MRALSTPSAIILFQNGGKYAIMRFTGLGLIILNFIRARIAAAPGDC